MSGNLEQYVNEQQLTYDKSSISISLVHEAILAAHHQGMNIQEILHRAGIQPELMLSSKARVSISQYAQLWIELANSMNDEFFGMDQHAMRRGSYQFISKAVMQCETLENALKDILKFLNFILDDFQSELCLEDKLACIVIHDKKQPKRMFSYATYLMLVHTLICWLSGQRIVLNQIQLKCEKPLDDEDYRVRFCSNIHYLATQNSVEFDREYLDIKIKQDKKSWYAFISQTPHNLLVRFKNPNALSTQIRKYLLQVPPAQWIELNALAQQLNMSEATIQRRLKSEGCSYQQLKNDIRRDTAIELLSKTDKPLHDISDELNFHDPSAFHRAFKKWTGLSPGTYRQLKD
ncbi:AraC family transcriptional regulator [Acinetobacter sp. GXMZU3951]